MRVEALVAIERYSSKVPRSRFPRMLCATAPRLRIPMTFDAPGDEVVVAGARIGRNSTQQIW